MNIRDSAKFAACEPGALKVIGEESERQGTDTLTPRQIDQVIKASRRAKCQERGRGENRRNTQMFDGT
jgi:hypothetical protein